MPPSSKLVCPSLGLFLLSKTSRSRIFYSHDVKVPKGFHTIPVLISLSDPKIFDVHNRNLVGVKKWLYYTNHSTLRNVGELGGNTHNHTKHDIIRSVLNLKRNGGIEILSHMSRHPQRRMWPMNKWYDFSLGQNSHMQKHNFCLIWHGQGTPDGCPTQSKF